mgnify:CR=1 FL=1
MDLVLDGPAGVTGGTVWLLSGKSAVAVCRGSASVVSWYFVASSWGWIPSTDSTEVVPVSDVSLSAVPFLGHCPAGLGLYGAVSVMSECASSGSAAASVRSLLPFDECSLRQRLGALHEPPLCRCILLSHPLLTFHCLLQCHRR